MNLSFIRFIVYLGVIFAPVSSQATPWTFFSQFPKVFKQPLIAQSSATEDVQEEMLIEGMDKGIVGDYQGAIEDFTEVIHLYPNSAEAYYNRGIAYTKLGNSQAAIADYNQAISLDPNLAEAYVDRALIYYQLGQSPAARKDLQRAADLFKQQGNTIAYNRTVKMLQKLP